MNRRTRSQHITDDLAFPVRVKFQVPRTGLGMLSGEIREWLGQEVGKGRFAIHNAQAVSSDAVGVYFVSLRDAQRFVAAFPAMEIADGTRSSVYVAP